MTGNFSTQINQVSIPCNSFYHSSPFKYPSQIRIKDGLSTCHLTVLQNKLVYYLEVGSSNHRIDMAIYFDIEFPMNLQLRLNMTMI